MKVCIIGGTGHIGKHLTPMFVREGDETIVITTGRTSVPQSGLWAKVQTVKQHYIRGNQEWAERLRSLEAEVVVDILGTDLPMTYEAVKGVCRHLIACGSLWMFGEPKIVPTPEVTQEPCIFTGYAQRYQELFEVKEKAKRDGLAFTAIMPPNICGPGKIPLEAMGGRSLDVHKAHQQGNPVPLPEPGTTLIGPCDAEDVARGFFLAAKQTDQAADEVFNVGSSYALPAWRFVEIYAGIYGSTIPINWMSWQEYVEKVSPDPGANYHFKAHMCPDISKISAKLGYDPRYTPEVTMARAVNWMREERLV